MNIRRFDVQSQLPRKPHKECPTLQSHDQTQSLIERAILERPRWTAIRSEAQRAFNVRLKDHNLKTSAWKAGANPVDRLLGKELCVLAWAIEGMDEGLFPIAVRNWLALRPEERCRLFGMTAITTGGVNDCGKGWRLALLHAQGDVAQSELFKPRSSQTVRLETVKNLKMVHLACSILNFSLRAKQNNPSPAGEGASSQRFAGFLIR